MRYLDRKRITPPDVLINLNGSGVSETQDAIVFFTQKASVNGKSLSFKYSAYASPEVKAAVCELSYNKCAYCEIKAVAGYDGDIEHFRPKGEVTQENSTSLKPGYYWLGAAWENLFLSCQHCNQSRRQPTPEGKKITMGKKNQFPLSNNKKRIRTHKKKIDAEEPFRLLIDPSKEDPLDFLEFDEKGMVYPRRLADNSFDRKGEASIEVFALLRMILVEAREKHALMVMTALKTYEDHVKELNDNINILPQSFVDLKRKNLEQEILRLKVYTQEDQAFSAMAYFLIKQFLAKMGVTFK